MFDYKVVGRQLFDVNIHFDYMFRQGALDVSQVKRVEEIANEVSMKNEVVYMKNATLAQAKAVKGLRAVFDEVTLALIKFQIWIPIRIILEEDRVTGTILLL